MEIMLQFREEKYVEKIPTNIECILGADIGGTNSNFGIFEVINKDLRLILSLHLKSQQIKNCKSVRTPHCANAFSDYPSEDVIKAVD